MFDNLKCKFGFHKPVTKHFSFKYKFRTTNKGRAKKRYRTGIKELHTVIWCERCGKTLKSKVKFVYR